MQAILSKSETVAFNIVKHDGKPVEYMQRFPIDVPDDVYVRFQAAQRALQAIADEIEQAFGESPVNDDDAIAAARAEQKRRFNLLWQAEGAFRSYVNLTEDDDPKLAGLFTDEELDEIMSDGYGPTWQTLVDVGRALDKIKTWEEKRDELWTKFGHVLDTVQAREVVADGVDD